MRKIVPLLIGVAATAMALAASAHAAEPSTFVFTVDNFTWTDDRCGFPITHVENGTGKVTVFFDQQGNPTKAIGTRRRHSWHDLKKEMYARWKSKPRFVSSWVRPSSTTST